MMGTCFSQKACSRKTDVWASSSPQVMLKNMWRKQPSHVVLHAERLLGIAEKLGHSGLLKAWARVLGPMAKPHRPNIIFLSGHAFSPHVTALKSNYSAC